MFKFFKPPEKLNKFVIPVLFKEMANSYVYGRGHTTYEVLHEAYTDGFYYEKQSIRYFRVKQKDKDPVFMSESSLVFLKDAD